MCIRDRSFDGDQALDRDHWLNRIEELAEQGQRVLAIAMKPVAHQQVDLKFSDVKSDLIFLGMFGFIDPPRQEAIEAVDSCGRAGIRVKMITGDHGTTALAVARQLKLVNTNEVITGQQLDEMSEDALRKRVQDVDVYARVNPEHKLRLVRLLQEHGLIVAMTGDDSGQIATDNPEIQGYPCKENKKCRMHININTGKTNEFPGPLHISMTFIFSIIIFSVAIEVSHFSSYIYIISFQLNDALKASPVQPETIQRRRPLQWETRPWDQLQLFQISAASA